MEDAGARQALTLRQRIKYCDFAQVLANLLSKNPKTIPTDAKVREALNGLAQQNTTVPFEIQLAITEKYAKDTLASVQKAWEKYHNTEEEEHRSEAETMYREFVDLIIPFPDGDERADEFDPVKPRISSLISFLQDAEQSQLVEIKYNPTNQAFDPDAKRGEEAEDKEEEEEFSRADLIEHMWKDGWGGSRTDKFIYRLNDQID